MYDRPNAGPSATNPAPSPKDIADVTAAVLHPALCPGEVVSHVVTIAEVVRYYDDDRPPSYRRIRLTDVRTHPGILESLVRNAADDMTAELHPSNDAHSGRFQRHGS